MMTSKVSVLGASTFALALLAGCATEVEGENDEAVTADVAEQVNAADESEPAALPRVSLTGPCTTTTSCDANYCCTTEDCRFTTTVTCKPRLLARAW